MSYAAQKNIEDDNFDWKEVYLDAAEELPPDMLEPKGKAVQITAYIDADHARGIVTRRSVTGILIFLNSTPVWWVCKHQKTVETSTYGSELMATRIATKVVMELKYQLKESQLMDHSLWMETTSLLY